MLDRCMIRLGAKVLLIFCLALVAEASAPEFLAASSVDVRWQPEHARLTLGGALLIAESEASKNHVNFSDYATPLFRYYHDDHLGYLWSFIFQGKAHIPGNHFMVVVNDQTQHSDFIPGE